MPRLPWTTRADNRKTLEDFAAKADLISKREAIRKNEEESAVYDYAATRARNEVQHIDREHEGMKAALESTKIPVAPVVAEVIYRGAPVKPADTDALVQEGREIFNQPTESSPTAAPAAQESATSTSTSSQPAPVAANKTSPDTSSSES